MVGFVVHFVSLIFGLTFQYDSGAYERDKMRTNMFAHITMCFWFFAGTKGKNHVYFTR